MERERSEYGERGEEFGRQLGRCGCVVILRLKGLLRLRGLLLHFLLHLNRLFLRLHFLVPLHGLLLHLHFFFHTHRLLLHLHFLLHAHRLLLHVHFLLHACTRRGLVLRLGGDGGRDVLHVTPPPTTHIIVQQVLVQRAREAAVRALEHVRDGLVHRDRRAVATHRAVHVVVADVHRLRRTVGGRGRRDWRRVRLRRRWSRVRGRGS